MDTIKSEFVSNEQRDFKFKLGTLIASSLSGFIAGALAASIAWLLYIMVGKL